MRIAQVEESAPTQYYKKYMLFIFWPFGILRRIR